MPETEPHTPTLYDLKAALPLLPCDTPVDLALIAFSKSSELEGAVTIAQDEHRELVKVHSGRPAEKASEDYEIALNTVGALGQFGISKALEKKEEALRAKEAAEEQLEVTTPRNELANTIDKRKARLSAPVRWPAIVLSTLAFTFGGHELSKVGEQSHPERYSIYDTRFLEGWGAALGFAVGSLAGAAAEGQIARGHARLRVKKPKNTAAKQPA